VCEDHDENGAEGCATWGSTASANPPNCTGTYNATTHVVSNTPCNPKKFFQGVANEYELIFP
jgi:hypothetical protein